MVSKLDVLLAVGIFPGSAAKEILQKLGKKAVSYNSVYNLLKELESQAFVRAENNTFFLSESIKAKRLFWLVDFCFENGIDYRIVVSEKTAEFVKIGLEKGKIEESLFNPRTSKKIVLALSKHGFAVVESRKPFVCRIVFSKFLRELVEHFFGKVEVLEENFLNLIDEKKLDNSIEKEFSEFKKFSKRNIEFDEIGFIHSSLSLEGNTLTLPETEKLLRQNISPKSKPFKDALDVANYKKAIDGFVLADKELTLESVLSFHAIAMNSLQSGAGELRKHNVKIKGNPNFKTPDWNEVPLLLKNFFEICNSFFGQKKLSVAKIVENASFLHNEFQRIHPFIDGNSRTSRAIFCKILFEKGFSLIKIPMGFSEQYMNLTKLSQKRDDKKFSMLMKQIVLENLKQENRKMKYAY